MKNELRINNWVNDGFSDIQIEAEDFLIMSDAPDGLKIKPTPLTEQWLVDFGFEFDGFLQEWRKPDDLVGVIVESGENGIFRVEFYYSYVDLKYVHQLQNLYFVLTGKELTIKEA